MKSLAIDLRELRRPGTGIGRWIRNFLDAKFALAPDVPVVGLGASCEGVDAALLGPSLPWTGVHLNPILDREGVGLWLSPYFKIPPGLSVDSIATVHDTIPAKIFPRKYVFSLRLMVSLRTAWKIATVSETSREDLVKNYRVAPDQLVLAYNSVGRVFSGRVEERDDRYLKALKLLPRGFFLSVIDDRPHKNLETLVSALGDRGDLRVVIVGSKRKDLPEPFRVLPYLDDIDLAVLYRHARALLHPARAEGFGLPALEAMACGTPLILSDIPPMREIAQDRARYVAPDDAAGWRRAVDDPPSADGLLDRAAAFRAEVTYKDLWSVIRGKLNSSPAA